MVSTWNMTMYRVLPAVAMVIFACCAEVSAAEGLSLEEMQKELTLQKQCSSLKIDVAGRLKACTEAIALGRKGDDMGMLPVSLDMRASAYEEAKDFDRALKDRSEAVGLRPKDTYPLAKRAQTYEKKGDWDSALADYNAWIKLKPNDSGGYSARARVYVAKKQFDLAIADLTKTITLTDAKFASPYFIQRGDIYRERNELDRAMAEYDTSIRMNPEYILAYYNRGLVKRAKGDSSGADADIAVARKVNPNIGR
jgi:tetratricopeptide (TPR) repeat protein